MALRPISFTFFARPTLCLAFKKNGTPVRPGAPSGSPKNKDWRKPASAPALSAVRLSPKLPWFHLYFNSCKNFGNLLFAPKPTQVGFDTGATTLLIKCLRRSDLANSREGPIDHDRRGNGIRAD